MEQTNEIISYNIVLKITCNTEKYFKIGMKLSSLFHVQEFSKKAQDGTTLAVFLIQNPFQITWHHLYIHKV